MHRKEDYVWQNLQNGMSCHSSQFWHFHKPPAEGWLQWFDLPVTPENDIIWHVLIFSGISFHKYHVQNMCMYNILTYVQYNTLFTCIFPESASAFFPPATAIVAKYWMTRLVLTVFPAPDSPLEWIIWQTYMAHLLMTSLSYISPN